MIRINLRDGSVVVVPDSSAATSVVNVQDPQFGAVGNGVADDTAAIREAVEVVDGQQGARDVGTGGDSYGMHLDPRQVPADLKQPAMDAGHPSEPEPDSGYGK